MAHHRGCWRAGHVLSSRMLRATRCPHRPHTHPHLCTASHPRPSMPFTGHFPSQIPGPFLPSTRSPLRCHLLQAATRVDDMVTIEAVGGCSDKRTAPMAGSRGRVRRRFKTRISVPNMLLGLLHKLRMSEKPEVGQQVVSLQIPAYPKMYFFLLYWGESLVGNNCRSKPRAPLPLHIPFPVRTSIDFSFFCIVFCFLKAFQHLFLFSGS